MNEAKDGEAGGELAEKLDVVLRAAREHGAAHVAASLSHALGTPLQVIAGRAAMVRADPEDADRHLELIEKKVKETTEMLGRVLDYLRPDEAPSTCDLVDVCRVVVGIERSGAAARHVELHGPSEGRCSVRTSRRALEQALLGLVASALAASNAGGAIALSVREETCEPPESVRAFARGGPTAVFELDCRKAAAPRVDHVREPWLADSFGERSIELPQALAHQVARKHGGWIESDAGDGGVVLRLYWPVARTSP